MRGIKSSALMRAGRKRGPLFLAILSTVGAISWFLVEHPILETSGDEPAYFRGAVSSHRESPSLLDMLPGNMPLRWWPPLTFEIYGLLVVEEALDPTREQLPHSRLGTKASIPAAFMRRVSVWNAGLLVLSGILVYLIARRLGISRGAAALAFSASTLNPRFLYYVQGLWPECLHAVVFLAAMLLLLRSHRGENETWLALGSTAMGISALIKGIAGGYMLVLMITLLATNRRRGLARLGRVAIIALVPFAVVTLPQMLRNHHEEGVFAISTNTWVNLEAGLVPPSEAQELGFRSTFDLYQESSPNAIAREKLSRARVISYLAECSPLDLLQTIARNYLFSVQYSFFAGGARSGRWADTQALTWMVPFVIIGSVLVLVFGVLGIVTGWRRSNAHAVVAAFLVYYLLALGLVGFNPRFFVQAIPFLTIMAVDFCDRTIRTAWSR